MTAGMVAAAALAKAAAYDPMMLKPNPTTLAAWTEALDGIELREATDAVAEHYARTRERIMPADLLAIVRRERRAKTERRHSQLALGAGDLASTPAGTADVHRLHTEAAATGPCAKCQVPKNTRCHRRIPCVERLQRLAKPAKETSTT